MKKYKLVIFMASLVLIVAVLAGCTSSNPVAEELAKQRAALTIGNFNSELHSITANGTKLGSEKRELFEVGSDVRLVVEPADGYEFLGWDFDENATSRETILVMYEDNTRITPLFSEVDTGDVGAEGLTIVMETQPGDTVAGSNIEGPPAVIIENDEGPVAGVEVSVSLDAEISLGGTMVQTTDENGIAIFDDLVINPVVSGLVLVFDAEFADLPLRVESEPFDVVESDSDEVEEEVDVYTLTMEVPEGEGSVTPEVGDHEFNDGTIVELKAVPDEGEMVASSIDSEEQDFREIEGWEFKEWTGDVENIEDTNAAETTITMNGNATIKAVFVEVEPVEPETFDVNLSVDPEGSGAVNGSGTYQFGDSVSIEATSEKGYKFVNWT
ncbi:MAG: hypothetical protein ABR596_04230, partial [Halarsenatibacteraceae bacterium]